MRRAFNISLSEDLVARVDVAAGDVPRSRFVERALEAALGGANPVRTDDGRTPVAPSPPSPASPRAPGSHSSTSRVAAESEPVGAPLPKIAKRHWAE